MNRIEKTIDIATWNRKEHFEHFSAFDDPFFGVTVNVDCTRSHRESKEKKLSFSLLILHRIISAAIQVEEFRYRIDGDKVVCYDCLHPGATISRPDHTFSFALFKYNADEETFIRQAQEEIEYLIHTTGLNKERAFCPNSVHYSTVPWFSFTDMKHPTSMRSGDSCPKISTGKYFREGDKLMLPISITCHHGLMDGYHVSQFIEKLDL